MKRRLFEDMWAWKRWARILFPVVVILLGALALALFTRHAAFQLANTVENAADNAAQAAMEKKVFESPLAGRWYDADKDKLTAEIDGYLAKVDAPPVENVHALIVPHAG